MFYKHFDKTTLVGAAKNGIIPNQQLADKLHKPVISKFEKLKVHSSFINNVWCEDLSDMHLICKFNKEGHFLLCANDLFSRYTWTVSLKEKVK